MVERTFFESPCVSLVPLSVLVSGPPEFRESHTLSERERCVYFGGVLDVWILRR